MKKLIIPGMAIMLALPLYYFLFTDPHDLKLRVVDESGHPVADAKIDYLRQTADHTSKWGYTTDYFTGVTDEDGEFTKRYDMDLAIKKISKTGYYPIVNPHFWPSGSQPPADWVTAVLTREHPRQLMIQCSVRVSREDLNADAFGIRFRYPGAGNSEGVAGPGFPRWQKWCLTMDPARADAWLVLVHQPGDAAWIYDVHVRGENGWEVAAGAGDEKTSAWQAPVDGYGPEVHFRSDRCPPAVFLRWSGGKRYGKIVPRMIQDSWFMDLTYAVQVEETGSRSLNPLTKKDLPDLDERLRRILDPGALEMLEACERFDREKIEELLAAGVSIDVEDDGGKTPLLRAVDRLWVEKVKYLLEKGADPEHADGGGTRPLHMVSGEERPSQMAIARLLLERKVDVNAREKDGRTPLAWAIISGNRPLVDLLIAHRADVNYRWRYHDTPDCTLIKLALMKNHPELIPVLRQAGAKE